MKVVLHTLAGRFYETAVDETTPLETVKAFFESETRIPRNQYIFIIAAAKLDADRVIYVDDDSQKYLYDYLRAAEVDLTQLVITLNVYLQHKHVFFFRPVVAPAAQGLINQFFGPDGDYDIASMGSLGVGIRVLYLERAIAENCDKFLISLDRLYASHHDIELIRALKLVNDLCCNSIVHHTYETAAIDGTFIPKASDRPALRHYFGGLGAIRKIDREVTAETPYTIAEGAAAAELKTAIKKTIQQRITALKQGPHQAEAVAIAAFARIATEVYIVPNTKWRKTLGLPNDQQKLWYVPRVR